MAENESGNNRLGVYSLLGWVVGVSGFVSAITFLTSGAIISGIAATLIGFIAIPKLANYWQNKIGIELSTGVTFIAVAVLFAVVGSTMPDVESATVEPQANTDNTQQTTSTNQEETTSSQNNEITEATAGQVYTQAQDNEIAAEERYGNGVRMTGTIDSVGEDILSDPYVTVYSTNEFETVQAMVESDSANELSELESGQNITVECEGIEATIQPILRNCTIQ